MTDSYQQLSKKRGHMYDLIFNSRIILSKKYRQTENKKTIIYGFYTSKFGKCIIAHYNNQICALSFVKNNNIKALEHWMKFYFGASFNEFELNNEEIKQLGDLIFNIDDKKRQITIYIYLEGTDFQIKVWETLAGIEFGKTISYKDLANKIGKPNAHRAAATALGKNPVSFLIPCHRVIRKNGEIGNYGSGKQRKKALLKWERKVRKKLWLN